MYPSVDSNNNPSTGKKGVVIAESGHPRSSEMSSPTPALLTLC